MSAYSVKEWCGWNVEYGPVRAEDLPEYLKTHRATPEMRRVNFSLKDRIVLIPVELMNFWVLLLLALGAIVFLLRGSGALLAAVLAGVVLFPILLPWIPVKDFSAKGLLLGLVVALPFAYYAYTGGSGTQLSNALSALAYLLMMPPVTAFFTLNFTGSTTFTSRTGVRKEIYRYIPVMAALFAIGLIAQVLNIALWSWKVV